jgi:hypothetical protein
MTARLARPLALLLALAAGLALSACGNKLEVRTQGEVEGLYIDVGPLLYQVQISRQLNPYDVEDQAYLKGLPPGTTPPAADETWFAVFIRVSNQTEDTRPAADKFVIVDTQEIEYERIEVDPAANPFAYRVREIGPKGVLPTADSPAASGPVQGALLLYKLKFDALQNRPIELKISNSAAPGQEGTVDLDV